MLDEMANQNDKRDGPRPASTTNMTEIFANQAGINFPNGVNNALSQDFAIAERSSVACGFRGWAPQNGLSRFISRDRRIGPRLSAGKT